MFGKTISRLLATLVVCGGARAVAAPATPEEAQRLTALLERYVGHPAGQPSAVTVTPHGEAYTATVDIGRVLSIAATMGATVTAGALKAELTPQDDGRWRVALDGFPPVGIADGEQAFSFVVDGYTLAGLFDPAIHTFATASTTTSGSTVRATGKQGPVDVKLTDNGSGTTTARDAGSGTVDVTMTSSLKDVVYAITTQAKAPAETTPPAGTTVSAATVESAFDATHVPIVAIEDLWQFLVAHSSQADIAANQADLKTKLKALLAVTTGTTGDLKLSKIGVVTSLGAFGLDSFAEHYDDVGPQANGGVFTRLTAAGLRLPPGLVPDWAGTLLPLTVDIGQSFAPVDLKTGLTMAIDDAEFSADKPLTDAQQAAVGAAFSGGDKVLVFAPSTIVTASLTLKFAGETKLTKPLPTGSGAVSATGLDKTIETIRAAAPDDPTAAQAIAVLTAAKAIGKADGPDSYSWRIEAGPGGAVTVNGTPLGGAGQTPRPAPNPAP